MNPVSTPLFLGKKIIENESFTLTSLLENKVYFPSIQKTSTISNVAINLLKVLSKEPDFSSYKLTLKGSSVTNSCVSNIYKECNDIDLELEYITETRQADEFYEKIDLIFKNVLEEISKFDDPEFKKRKKSTDVRSSAIFYADDHTRKLYDIAAAKSDIISYLPLNTPVYLTSNPYFAHHITSDIISYLPLNIPVYLTSNPYFVRHITNGNSFYIPLQLFDDAILGGYEPGKYMLFSREGDFKSVIQQVKQEQITSTVSQKVDKMGWYRYLMDVTEWGISQDPSINDSFYYKNVSLGGPSIEELDRFTKGKRKNSNYPLFFYINALFHTPEECPFQKDCIEHILSLLNNEEQTSSFIFLQKNLEKSPKNLAFIILRLFIPCIAEKSSTVDHLGKKQLRCTFSSEGHSFYILVPFFINEVIQFQENGLYTLSDLDWNNFKPLFANPNKELEKTWKVFFIWIITHLSFTGTPSEQEFLQELWNLTNKVPLKNCPESFCNDYDRFSYFLKACVFLKNTDESKSHFMIENALKLPPTEENRSFFKKNMPPDDFFLQKTFEFLIAKQDVEKALRLLHYYGEAFSYTDIVSLYAKLPVLEEVDLTIIDLFNQLQNPVRIYPLFYTRDRVATAIEKTPSFLQALEKNVEVLKDPLLERIKEVAKTTDIKKVIILIEYFSVLEQKEKELVSIFKNLLQNLTTFPKKKLRCLEFIQTKFPQLSLLILVDLLKERDSIPLDPAALALFTLAPDLQEEQKWISYFADPLRFNQYEDEEQETIRTQFSSILQRTLEIPFEPFKQWTLLSLLCQMLPYYTQKEGSNFIKTVLSSIRQQCTSITPMMWNEISNLLEKSDQLQLSKNPWKLLFNDLIYKNDVPYPFIVTLSESTKTILLSEFPKIFSDTDKKIEFYEKAFKHLYQLDPLKSYPYFTGLLKTISSDTSKDLSNIHLPIGIDLEPIFQQFLEEKKETISPSTFLKLAKKLLGNIPISPLYLNIPEHENIILEILQDNESLKSIWEAYRVFHSCPRVLDFIEETYLILPETLEQKDLFETIDPLIFITRIQDVIQKKPHIAEMLFHYFLHLKKPEIEKINGLQDYFHSSSGNLSKKAEFICFACTKIPSLINSLFKTDLAKRYAFLLTLLQHKPDLISHKEKKEFISLVLSDIQKNIQQAKDKESFLKKVEESLIFMEDHEKFQLATLFFEVPKKSERFVKDSFYKALSSIHNLKECFQKNPKSIESILDWIVFLKRSALNETQIVEFFVMQTYELILETDTYSDDYFSLYLPLLLEKYSFPLLSQHSELYNLCIKLASTHSELLSKELALKIVSLIQKNSSNGWEQESSIQLAYFCIDSFKFHTKELLWVSGLVENRLESPELKQLSLKIAEKSPEAAVRFLSKLKLDLTDLSDSKQVDLDLLRNYLSKLDASSSLNANESTKELLLFFSDYLIRNHNDENKENYIEITKSLISLCEKTKEINTADALLPIYFTYAKSISDLDHFSYFTGKDLKPLIERNPLLFDFIMKLKITIPEIEQKLNQDSLCFLLHIIPNSIDESDSKEIFEPKINMAYECIAQLDDTAKIPFSDIRWLLRPQYVRPNLAYSKLGLLCKDSLDKIIRNQILCYLSRSSTIDDRSTAIPAGSQFVEPELVGNNTLVDSKATSWSAASEMLGLPPTNLPMEGPNGPNTPVSRAPEGISDRSKDELTKNVRAYISSNPPEQQVREIERLLFLNTIDNDIYQKIRDISYILTNSATALRKEGLRLALFEELLLGHLKKNYCENEKIFDRTLDLFMKNSELLDNIPEIRDKFIEFIFLFLAQKNITDLKSTNSELFNKIKETLDNAAQKQGFQKSKQRKAIQKKLEEMLSA